MIMYTGQAIKRMMYGDRLIRPKSPKVKTLPIAYNITEAHTDFPIYIKPTAITGFGSLTLAEAQSLRFYADSAKTVELPREIVSADEIYVKNTLATGTGNKLYLDWDGVSADYANNATYGRNNTWNSNYKAVYHFEGNANDSTSNGNNGTGYNMTYSGGAGVFNGSSSYIQVSNNTLASSILSVQIQADFATYSNSLIRVLIGHVTRTPGDIFFGQYRGTSSGNTLFVVAIHANTPVETIGGIPPGGFNLNTKYFLDYTYNTTSKKGKGYWNGGIYGDVNFTTANIPTAGTTYIGRGYQNSRYHQGKIWEIRVLFTDLSPSRISTEYANQSNPATFFGTLS